MNKEFWTEIYKNKYETPAHLSLTELTTEIFSYIGNVDPQLRDDIGYTVYANWLKQDRYSVNEIRAHIIELLANLDQGIGATESDSVFLRTFSILFLAEIVHNDNKRNFLEKSDIQTIYAKGIEYITAEKDPRGYIPVKGWAHALAHSADLALVLSKNRFIEAKQLPAILNVISEKIIHASHYLYINGEDERLASAIVEVLRRNVISNEDVKHWAVSFINPGWKGAYMDAERNCAFQNCRNLLRSIYLELKHDEGEIPERAEYELIFLEVLKGFKPF